MDRKNFECMSDRPVSVDADFLEKPRRACFTAHTLDRANKARKAAATRLAHFLILGRVRQHFPHLLEKPYGPPSIGEMRKLYVWLLRVRPEHIDLIGGDNVVLDAIERWQANEPA